MAIYGSFWENRANPPWTWAAMLGWWCGLGEVHRSSLSPLFPFLLRFKMDMISIRAVRDQMRIKMNQTLAIWKFTVNTVSKYFHVGVRIISPRSQDRLGSGSTMAFLWKRLRSSLQCGTRSGVGHALRTSATVSLWQEDGLSVGVGWSLGLLWRVGRIVILVIQDSRTHKYQTLPLKSSLFQLIWVGQVA